MYSRQAQATRTSSPEEETQRLAGVLLMDAAYLSPNDLTIESLDDDAVDPAEVVELDVDSRQPDCTSKRHDRCLGGDYAWMGLTVELENVRRWRAGNRARPTAVIESHQQKLVLQSSYRQLRVVVDAEWLRGNLCLESSPIRWFDASATRFEVLVSIENYERTGNEQERRGRPPNSSRISGRYWRRSPRLVSSRSATGRSSSQTVSWVGRSLTVRRLAVLEAHRDGCAEAPQKTERMFHDRTGSTRLDLRQIVARKIGGLNELHARQTSRYGCLMVEIDGTRLVASLRRLRKFGATGTGVVRQMFSAVDMDSRRWLVEQMTDAGLDAQIDGVGTVFGRSRNPGPALVIGSHSDTQPEGGWLDGAMGVMYGIEVARALRDDPATSHLAVDVASWADEEGTYTSFLGSRSFVGVFPDSALDDAREDGETVRQALERLGLASVARATLEPARHTGYLEAHIEQGPHLEDTGKRIGVVTAIVGIRTMHITFVGEQNHAGSTPMPRRKDAGVALFDFGVRIRERLMTIAGPTTVWTIGNGRLLPGGESIIPGEAWCGLQFRDPSDDIMDTFQTAITDLAAEMTAEGPVAVSAELRRAPMSPAVMNSDFRGHLCEAAERRVPGAWVEMPSAAMHDANVMSEHAPSCMLFIPSIGGISHDFAEDSTELDIVTGCQVLADAAAAILISANKTPTPME